jgi:hypothetical protein
VGFNQNYALRTLTINPEDCTRLGGGGWWPDIPREVIDLLRGDNAPEDTQTGQGVTWSPTEGPSLWLRGSGNECQPDIPSEADITPTAAYTARGSPDLPRPEARSVDQRAAVIESTSAELLSRPPSACPAAEDPTSAEARGVDLNCVAQYHPTSL